jgi:2-polyprenyl-3-methyl-5-hydroxy-6-metoxy-1,4-benzoquinol methylase
MKKAKTSVEAQFDKFFSQKPVVQYEFDRKKMGQKDKKIIQCLSKYGIKGKKCLDTGPGTGRWLHFLKSNGSHYLAAIDISQKSLANCSHLCNKTQKANCEKDNFDFESDFFDIVISIEVLEHLRNPDNYLSEILRVTKKRGIILMSTPNISSFISRLRMLLGFLPVAVSTDKTHVRFYRKKDIVKLFALFNLQPQFIPTSISLNPFNSKSKINIPSLGLISSLDDSLLFMIQIEKR